MKQEQVNASLSSLVPLLIVRNAKEAIDFYRRAFGAEEIVRYENKINDTISHADLVLVSGSAHISLSEEARAWNSDAPPSLGGSAVVLQLDVVEVEGVLARVVDAGAEIVFPLQEFCGERMCRVRDPFGHLWILRERVAEMSVEENQRQRDALFASFAAAAAAAAAAPAGLAQTQRAHRESSKEARVSTSFASASELARRIRAKELSSVELTRHFIERIERFDPRTNAVIARDFERALVAAKAADEAIARGDTELGPLHGVPITIKESFDVAGLATTWGLEAQAKNVAVRDAHVVERSRAAGAVILGKTNVPPMLADFQTDNALFGRTNNPWDATRSPGGSSGGAAAAVAAGLTALDTGSDIGGSVRNPAHYCGVFAHKPTWNSISLRGHAFPGSFQANAESIDMAVAGPIARSAEDLSLALDVLRRTKSSIGKKLGELRVATWPTESIAPVDDEIAARVVELGALLAAEGCRVSEGARPAIDWAEYRRTYVALVTSLSGAVVSDAMFEANRARAAALQSDDASRMAAVTRALVLDHRAWLHHDAKRSMFREAWRAFFEEWDILLCPIMATTAFVHDARPAMERTLLVNGAAQPFFEQVFWSSLATLSYLPATVFPTGLSKDGLPIGLQAIGAEHADATTIEFARLATSKIGGFAIPPSFA